MAAASTRRITRGIAALLSLLVLVGAVGAVALRGRSRRPASRPAAVSATTSTAASNGAASNGAASGGARTTASTAPTTTTPVPPEVEAAIHQLMAFVETARGLKFKSEVPVALLDDAAFTARLNAGAGVSQADATKTEKVLRAIGLLPANVDVAAEEKKLTSGAVIGLYDPKSKSLLVRGANLTPMVRYTLVHELTHALQDQWFGLDRPAIDKANDESPLAFSSLVEGDAVRIQQAYLRSLPASQQSQISKEEQSSAPNLSAIPDVLVQLLYFPYTYGLRFVNTVVASAGQARLDQAFTDPPTTSSQIIHPDRFVAGDPPVPVPQPSADGPLVDNGPLGQIGFFLMLNSKLDTNTAAHAADGWAGDNYAAYDAGGKTCVRDAVVMDNPADAAALDAALRAYARKRAGVTIQGGNPYQWTACG